MQSQSIRWSGQPTRAHSIIECVLLTGTRSAVGIMASGQNMACWALRIGRREVRGCGPMVGRRESKVPNVSCRVGARPQ
jgi:hypothetical protein